MSGKRIAVALTVVALLGSATLVAAHETWIQPILPQAMSSPCECCSTARRSTGLPLAPGVKVSRANHSSRRMRRAGHPSACLEWDGGFCSAPICGAQRSPDSNGGAISLLRRLVCARSREDLSAEPISTTSGPSIYSTTPIRIVLASSGRPERSRRNSQAY
jgi:hypothetical protein